MCNGDRNGDGSAEHGTLARPRPIRHGHVARSHLALAYRGVRMTRLTMLVLALVGFGSLFGLR